MRIGIKFFFCLAFLNLLVLFSCGGGRTHSGESAFESDASVISSEDRIHGKDFKWKFLTFSDGTYGAEVEGNIVLNNCEEIVYSEGYDGCYMFKTQKGNDKYLYDINGNEMFHINGIEFLNVMSYMTNDILKNGYLLVTDFDDNEGVYNLDGKEIISPQFSSISPIYSNLGNGERAIWGFKCDKRDDFSTSYVYDWYGNYVFSGKSLYQESNTGVLPLFGAEKNGVSGLYNHKGERILRVDDYDSYDIEITNEGMAYIVLETYEDLEEFREQSDCKWIDINGNTLKPVDGSRDFSLWNDNLEMTRRSKRELRENMKSINNVKPQLINHHSSGASNNYGGQIDGYVNSPAVINPNTPTEDNPRWEQHYKSTYAKYENRVIDLFNTLNTLQTTSNGGATSSYAISETKASIRNIQSEMKRVRNEAQQQNVYISVSSWETASY